MSASTAVFDTYELLDNILSNLDFHSLLKAQLVCKVWKIIIDRSQKAQENLFHRPTTAARSLFIWRDERAKVGEWAPDLITANAPDASEASTVAKIHPAFADAHDDEDVTFDGEGCITTIYFSQTTQLHFETLISSQQTTWKKALLTQPPCKSMSLACYMLSGEEEVGSVDRTITDENGVRLGMVAETLQSMVATFNADNGLRLHPRLLTVDAVGFIEGFICEYSSYVLKARARAKNSSIRGRSEGAK